MDPKLATIRPRPWAVAIAMVLACTAGPAPAADKAGSYKGQAVKLGKGMAHTIVRTDGSGKPLSIGVVFSEQALEGLPEPGQGADPNFPYLLPMPRKGPRTVIDHVVVNWESAGHPPPKVYDVPHFDFHFYLTSRAKQAKIRFKHDSESGEPAQQPPAQLLAPGYVVPPGTAVSGMGVHAINPAAPEFQGQPFNATFIYGYHDKRLTFLEPMASLSFLKTKPTFSAPLPRPASYRKPGAYPASYSIRYDPANRSYEVSLDELQ